MVLKSLGILLVSLLTLGCNDPQDEVTASPSNAKKHTNIDSVTTTDTDAQSDESSVDDTAQLESDEKLKSIARAFYAYQEHFGHFPPAVSTDANGHPLLSWRVHILPFLDAYDLYERFHLDEPWDSDHNSSLVVHMPSVYQTRDVTKDGHTTLMVFTGEHTVFGTGQPIATSTPLKPYKTRKQTSQTEVFQVFDGETSNPSDESSDEATIAGGPLARRPSAGPTFYDLTDGTANTILAVRAGSEKAVPWTKPEDLPFHLENPAVVLGDVSENGFDALFWDHRVERLQGIIDPVILRSWIDSTEHARRMQEMQGQTAQ